jgi:hypothetical protein
MGNAVMMAGAKIYMHSITVWTRSLQSFTSTPLLYLRGVEPSRGTKG